MKNQIKFGHCSGALLFFVSLILFYMVPGLRFLHLFYHACIYTFDIWYNVLPRQITYQVRILFQSVDFYDFGTLDFKKLMYTQLHISHLQIWHEVCILFSPTNFPFSRGFCNAKQYPPNGCFFLSSTSLQRFMFTVNICQLLCQDSTNLLCENFSLSLLKLDGRTYEKCHLTIWYSVLKYETDTIEICLVIIVFLYYVIYNTV